MLVSNTAALSRQPLDFEASPSYQLQVDARNPEPLMKGLQYGSESSAFISVSLTDVDEAPEFSLNILDVAVPENITQGSVLLTVEAKDPEGKEIRSELRMFPGYQTPPPPLVCFTVLAVFPQLCFLECFSLLGAFKICVKYAVNWSKQMSFFNVCLQD